MNYRIYSSIATLFLFATGMLAQQRSLEEIRSIADAALKDIKPASERAKVKIKTDEGSMLPSSLIMDTKSNAFYIFNDQTNGYVVVSADERMDPVLGLSDQGKVEAENIPANMRAFLQTYVKEYNSIQGKSIRQLPMKRIEGVRPTGVAPMVTAKWGQETPFNNLCPLVGGRKTLSGCVSISTSQTLHYYKYPSVGKGTISYTSPSNKLKIDADLSKYPFDWANIIDSYATVAMKKQQDAVAKLVYACAVAVKMDFGVDGSGATSSNQLLAFVDNFSYDKDMANIFKDNMTTSQWQTIMLKELNAGRPIIYGADDERMGGHSFIVDGYKADGDSYPYYHMNWGWSGQENGYFKLTSMSSAGYKFSVGHDAIINVMPDNGKQDNVSIWQAASVTTTTDRIDLKKTRDFTITLTKCFNCSYRTFQGTFEAYLQNKDGVETKIGSFNPNTAYELFYGFNSQSFKAVVPTTMSEGEYTLVIRTKASGSGEAGMVTYPNPVTITINSASQAFNALLMATSLTNIGGEDNGRYINVSATDVMNYNSGKTFSGNISMAVADSKGNILQRFGKEESISGLQYLYYVSGPKEFSGYLPDAVEDGEYRLYLVANQMGYTGWDKMMKYTIENNAITEYGTDLYITFWVEDGKVKFSNKESDLPEFYADLVLTDLTMKSLNVQNRDITVEIQNVGNFGERAFTGNISMALYDADDDFVTTFGEPWEVTTSLGQYAIFTSTYKLNGAIPYDVEDGAYKLYIAANQKGFSGWSKLTGLVLEEIDGQLYIIDSGFDMHLDILLASGKLYTLDTDGLMQTLQKNDDDVIFDLQGRRIKSISQSGIYIVNGKKTYVK